MKRRLLISLGCIFLASAWPIGNEVRKAVSPEVMLKRTKFVAEIEDKCRIRKFSTFVVRDKSLFAEGRYDFYEGSHYPSEEELIAINGGRALNPLPESDGLVSLHYFGDENALVCAEREMKKVGYTFTNSIGHGYFTWTALGRAK